MDSKFGGDDDVKEMLYIMDGTQASSMNNKARVIHQLLMKVIMPKASSRDLVIDIQKFCLCNVLKGVKVNLPSLVFNHLMT